MKLDLTFWQLNHQLEYGDGQRHSLPGMCYTSGVRWCVLPEWWGQGGGITCFF